MVCEEHTRNGSLHWTSTPEHLPRADMARGVGGTLTGEAGGKARVEAALGVRRRVVELWTAPRESDVSCWMGKQKLGQSVKRGLEEGLQLCTQHVQKPGGRAPVVGNR